MNRKTQIGIYLLVAAAAYGTSVAMPGAARADELTTKTVAWAVPAGFEHRFDVPQTLFTGTVGACGQPDLQIDKYAYDTDENRAVVDALIAKGTLASSSEDQTVWISNVDLPATEACAPVTPPATPSPTPTPTNTPQPVPTESTPAPTTAPPVTETPAPQPSTTASPVPSSSTTPVAATGNGSGPTQQRTATGPDSLAYTGSQSKGPLALGAGVLLVLGAALVVAGRRRKSRS